jgi:hypothetical protein
MEVIKRKIYLEDSISRTDKNWGKLTADTFYINVFLTQNIDNMGLFTDIEFNEKSQTPVNYSILTNKLSSSGITFPFMVGVTPTMPQITNPTEKLTVRLPSKVESDFYNYGNNVLTGFTESKIDEVTSYDRNDRYKVGLNIQKEGYLNYKNIPISGVSRVTSNSEPKIYAIDAEDNLFVGTNNQTTGFLYYDYTGTSRQVLIDGNLELVPLTTFKYTTEGINNTNVSLSAITKEEYLFGIISQPEVRNDVFIDRTITSVIDLHLRLSEIKNLDNLIKYGNGFYNITTI